MKLFRPTRFQLTPLMDLLLIIVFAQFLDVRQTSQQQADALREERSALQASVARQRAELTGIQTAITAERKSLENARDQARASRDMALAQRDQIAQQAEQSIRQLSEWLRLDPEERAEIETFGLGGDAGATQTRADAIERAEALAEAEPATVLRFLVAHDELLKRAEVWSIHATDRGEIQLLAGGQTETFRLETNAQSARADEAADQLFAAYKRLPQPKGLVILLISFDPRSVAGVYQPLLDAIPATLERLRADTPTTRFEYSVLGATPEPVRPRAAVERSSP